MSSVYSRSLLSLEIAGLYYLKELWYVLQKMRLSGVNFATPSSLLHLRRLSDAQQSIRDSKGAGCANFRLLLWRFESTWMLLSSRYQNKHALALQEDLKEGSGGHR